MSGKFEVKCAKNGSHYFLLKAGNGQVILQSQMYKGKEACHNGIDSVKKNASDGSHFHHLNAKDGQFYFTLHAGNGQVIGNSEMYTTKAACDNGVLSVQENAPMAEIIECE